VTGQGTDTVYQYSLSTAFDLSTTSYDSVSFNVSSQASTAFGLAFNNAGTKMYIVSFGNDTIYQYSLSSAFNLSTASYDSVSLDVNAQEAAPAGMTFNNDGTKMYIVGENGDEVNQYGLSTAFDLSNVTSIKSIAFSLSGQDSTPADIAFSNDGTKMFMVGYNTDAVYQYSTTAPAIITYPSTVEFEEGTAPTSPAIGETDVIAFSTRDGGTSYQAAQAVDGAL
jgi:sugar lactone lactonase YvrE